MRLIDADVLIDEINDEEFDTHEDYSRTFDMVDDAPTVDAELVEHGEWLICSDGYYPYCSKCKNEPQGRVMTDYCPNCGAKMDGGDENAEKESN